MSKGNTTRSSHRRDCAPRRQRRRARGHLARQGRRGRRHVEERAVRALRLEGGAAGRRDRTRPRRSSRPKSWSRRRLQRRAASRDCARCSSAGWSGSRTKVFPAGAFSCTRRPSSTIGLARRETRSSTSSSNGSRRSRRPFASRSRWAISGRTSIRRSFAFQLYGIVLELLPLRSPVPGSRGEGARASRAFESVRGSSARPNPPSLRRRPSRLLPQIAPASGLDDVRIQQK